jgi:hypothetical protein
MSEKDGLSSIKKAKEEEYFHRKEQELIENLRTRARSEAERHGMAEALGVVDQEILNDLEQLGYTRDTVMLLHLVPLLHVAWSDGSLSAPEVEQLRAAAWARGMEEGSPAHRQLEEWVRLRPSESFFQKTLRVIGSLLQALPADKRQAGAGDLLSLSSEIASASGGILGLGAKVSAAERRVLKKIAEELELNHKKATQAVVSKLSS